MEGIGILCKSGGERVVGVDYDKGSFVKVSGNVTREEAGRKRVMVSLYFGSCAH